MRLVSFNKNGQIVAGALVGEQVMDLAAAARLAGDGGDYASVHAIIRGGSAAAQGIAKLLANSGHLSAALQPLASTALVAPIGSLLRNAICVGRNYIEHVKEGAAVQGREAKLPEVPQFFTKASHTLNAPNGDVRLDPRVTQHFDYEVELAVIIGRSGRDISREQAMSYVYGYTVANDFTARDLQRRHDQWFKGKSLDTTLPLGPSIVTADEMGDPGTLELTLTVNGQERQRAHVSQMIFDIPTIISSLSASFTLDAGDVIATGTPSGVGFAMKPPQQLKDGDLVVTRIDRIGELRNRIVAVK